MQVLCQCRFWKTDNVCLTYLTLKRQLSHLNGCKLDCHQVFSVSGLALSYAANMFILMILYDFCLLPARFCYIIAYIQKVESRMQIADQYARWKISNSVENLVAGTAILRVLTHLSHSE
jgi:hypothetical protein